jgi:hypothetical protein
MFYNDGQGYAYVLLGSYRAFRYQGLANCAETLMAYELLLLSS